jgi:hypothetical protein
MKRDYNKILKNKNNELIYYIYDWDDNILFMPTKILVDKRESNMWVHKKVSTSKFRDIRIYIEEYLNKIYGEDESKYKWRFRNNDIIKSLSQFRDNGKNGSDKFWLDVKKAIIRKNFGPSFNNFIDTLINGRIFLICTARGHEPNSIRKGVKFIIFDYLSDEQKELMKKNLNEWGDTNEDNFNLLVDKYLNLCDYIGTDSDYFYKKFCKNGTALKPEDAKKIAIKHFIDELSIKYSHLYKDATVKIGFSDDTKKTLYHVEEYMRDELSLMYPMEFYIIDTSNPSIIGGIKKKV